MNSFLRSCCLSLALIVVCHSALGAGLDEDGFVSLFDGKSLEGWKNTNCAPSTWTVRDGMIHSTGFPTGELRTNRMYQNFILELEWRHLQPKGNAGVFVWADAMTAPGQPFHRAVEVQILDGREASWYTSHGDIFAIHGATWKPENGRKSNPMRAYPTEMRCKPSPEWNHYRIECVDGSISLAVNGKVVTQGSECSLRKGFICLESEGSPADFRNLRIKELPSTPLKPDQVAKADEGFDSLFGGVDFSGWGASEGHIRGWKVDDWKLSCDGLETGRDKDLWSDGSYKNFELIVDWRWNSKKDETGNSKAMAADTGIILHGDSKCQINISQSSSGSGGISGVATPATKADKPVGRWNRFRITMDGEHATVVLNGKTVVEKCHVPGISSEGAIVLQHTGSPFEFGNIYVKQLP